MDLCSCVTITICQLDLAPTLSWSQNRVELLMHPTMSMHLVNESSQTVIDIDPGVATIICKSVFLDGRTNTVVKQWSQVRLLLLSHASKSNQPDQFIEHSSPWSLSILKARLVYNFCHIVVSLPSRTYFLLHVIITSDYFSYLSLVVNSCF